MPGLGTLYGRGGATTFLMDLEHSDLILIQGSNFAENHPVGFRFVTKAKERGAKVIHIDPRFTRTSALADEYIPIRSGTDIAFTGGIINYVLQNEAYFKEYVVAYTNAAYIVDERFADTDDLDGIFSGFNAEKGTYDPATWKYELEESGGESSQAAGSAKDAVNGGTSATTGSHPEHGTKRPKKDETLQHPRCAINLLKKHFTRYTPEMVERITGAPKEQFIELCKLVVANSGRERTMVYCYAMGWAQHTVGVQNIRAAATLQALLGNTGRPGGGIMALRGHASIQGSTDIATLYDLLPGYIKAPSLERGEDTFEKWKKNWANPTGWWANWPKYAVSQLKAWYGEAARADNDWAYDYLPKNTGDHSHQPMFFTMKDGGIEGMILWGQNPAVGGQNAALQRAALGQLKWMVCQDLFETESAAFWKREGVDPATIGTEVFFMPAAAIAEKAGTLTNTMRLVQFHEKAVDSPGDARSDLSLAYNLGKRLKALYADSQLATDRPILDMTWNYDSDDAHERARGEPDVEKIMREINGYVVETGEQVKTFVDLKDDGSTAAGAWIYTGYFPAKDQNLTRRRKGDDWVSLEWAWAWPANRRNLYNRASADPDGKPWSERKKYIWWDEEAKKWTGLDVPDFPVAKAPTFRAQPGAKGMDAHDGTAPFIIQEYGVAEFFGVQGTVDGPFPTHYEPRESPVPNFLYPHQQYNPVLKEWRRRDNPYHAIGDPKYPYVLSTYRLTEHHLTGAMTRWNSWLAELQPEAFCEISPELAVELGIRNGDWVTISTARGEVEAKALVTGRITPFKIGPKQWVHQIGMPIHYGYQGLVTGDAANVLPPLVADPNVSIHEAKAFTCDLRLGRRGPAHEGPTWLPVPASEQRPLGRPDRGGRVEAGTAHTTDDDIVPAGVVMAGAQREHQLESSEHLSIDPEPAGDREANT
ncbi:MAG TPA: molybdopterin-dependent oxidoreductase [Candidatus Elarobacter sp.]